MVWYVWDEEDERFVRTRRPPQDSKPAKAIRRAKIRVAGVKDRQKLFEFRREAIETEPEIWLPDELDLHEIRKNIKEWKTAAYSNNFIIVAELGEKIIGFLHLTIYYRLFNGGPSAWVEDIFVLKNFRGYKVGTRLVRFAREIAKRKGCKTLRLIVGLENLAGLRFYKQCGFKISRIGLAIMRLR
ncbi:MAG: GNAT family N-acetyltransferase [Aigarchaeota archaeon]|nr:GNAT family N-acetyltransferase [Candidatus Pelearchaeum maunauluense]